MNQPASPGSHSLGTASSKRLSRREILKAGLGGLALAALPVSTFAAAGAAASDQPVPFLNTPRAGTNQLDWENLEQWLTPKDQVFNVQHYGIPEFNLADYALQFTGRIAHPMSFRLEQLKELPRKDQLMTLECSGNGSSKGFMNAVYNSRWTGTPLAPLLKKCRLDPKATEVVFYGLDRKTETLRPGTDRELKVEVPFGRSMSVQDAMELPLLLAYERNGEPIPKRNGAPVRLIVPGWYGIACVKWLTRIEVRDQRYMGRFMGRDYVTVRGERRGNEIVYVETSVERMNVKSVVARLTRRPAQDGLIPLRAFGAAWSGTEIKKVEVQVDGGPWRAANLDPATRSRYCWVFFSIDLDGIKPGKHTIVSRAFDAAGRIQPAADEDEIALKKTYWEAYQQWPREFEVGA